MKEKISHVLVFTLLSSFIACFTMEKFPNLPEIYASESYGNAKEDQKQDVRNIVLST